MSQEFRKLVGGYALCEFSLCIDFYVFPLSFRNRMETFHVRDESLSERDVFDINSVEISRFFREDFPGLIKSVRMS